MAQFELVERMTPNAVIKVVGVGGGGGNAVAHMVNSNIEGVEFITANTDAQAIKNCGAKMQLQLGGNVTKGLGAGANPEVGRQAALEDRERIIEALHGADMVFITAGMGGGTGTGAAPVVAQLAKEMGVLTVAVVTKPFPFEGRRRMQVALKGIEELSQHVDSLITIPNEKLITVLGRNATMVQAFRAANDVLQGAVQGIADLIVRPGLINVDFADVRTVMSEMGLAMMGTGHARGDDRAQAAAEAAIQNPLLDDVNLSGANGILVNITAGPDFTMAEFDEVGRTVEQFAAEDATVVIGTVLDPDMQDEVRVTVVATGLNPVNAGRIAPRHESRGYDAAPQRRPQVELVRERPKLDGTTGLPVDAIGGNEPYNPTHSISSVLRGRSQGAASVPADSGPAPAIADLPSDYLNIPAFLRRQAD
ncbi:cell division protein FtsZ [Solilutibacter silvestris]|uniref:Cell division protein FtsZ n=1 Tax=Solilutibacter silvestris TaxID=1645665 RepID=A0A2K1Q2L5_9GAMM|nr:cell division protein FtsZ [Lysobacter silvestris]PNS09286.1 ftsZ: cell division protein FtsZ [Lysobacter silvestris]